MNFSKFLLQLAHLKSCIFILSFQYLPYNHKLTIHLPNLFPMSLKIINKETKLSAAQSNHKNFHIQTSLLLKTQFQAIFPMHKDDNPHSIKIS